MQSEEPPAIYSGLIFYSSLFSTPDYEINLQEFFSNSYPFYLKFFSIPIIPISILCLKILREVLKTMRSFYHSYPNRRELYDVISSLIASQPPITILVHICNALCTIPKLYPNIIPNDFQDLYSLFISIITSPAIASSDSVGYAYQFIKLVVQNSSIENAASLIEFLITVQSQINFSTMSQEAYPIINMCEKLRLLNQIIHTIQCNYKKTKGDKDPNDNPDLVKYLYPFIPELLSHCNGEIEDDILNVLNYISMYVPSIILPYSQQYCELLKDKIINGGPQTKGISAKCIYSFCFIDTEQEFDYKSSTEYMLQLLNEGETIFTQFFFSDMLYGCGGVLSKSGLKSDNEYMHQFIGIIENILKENIAEHDPEEIHELFTTILSVFQMLYKAYETDGPFHEVLIKLFAKLARIMTSLNNKGVFTTNNKTLNVFCNCLETILGLDEGTAHKKNLTITSKQIKFQVNKAEQSLDDDALANKGRYIRNKLDQL